jgi:subtilisin family serine protease
MAANPTCSEFRSVGLDALMALGHGREQIVVALLDGPVDLAHPGFGDVRIRKIGAGACGTPPASACRHGTFMAGILGAGLPSAATGICSGCTILVRPVFADDPGTPAPRCSAAELAAGIDDALSQGAKIINISGALSRTVGRIQRLEDSLAVASLAGSLVVAAAGNDATVTGSVLTQHMTVIPVAGADQSGRPTATVNLGRSLGIRGIAAPDTVTSIAPAGGSVRSSGTSVAAAIVSGTCALLWSAFPQASASDIRKAVLGTRRRSSIAPPLLDAWSAYEALRTSTQAA